MALSAQALCLMDGTGIGLKDELGIPQATTTYDGRLERLIEAVSQEISRYCCVPSFHYESAREDDVRTYGTPLLHVPKTPLLSIGSIVYDPNDGAETVASSEYTLDQGSYGRIYREGGWLWTAAQGSRILSYVLAGTEQHQYRVTYACGYRTRNQVQNTLTTKLDGAAEVAVVVDNALPTDTPATGSIRVQRDDGTWLEVDYTSWTSKTFTIGATDFSGTEAAAANAVEVTSNLTLPADLEDAAIRYAAMQYRWSARDPSVKSEKLGAWAASYATDTVAGGIPPEIQQQLAPYRRVVFA